MAELRSELIEWVKAYKDVAERNALAETPKESAEYLLSLITEKVEAAGMTEEQYSALQDTPLDLTKKWATSRRIAQAQLQAIKEILK